MCREIERERERGERGREGERVSPNDAKSKIVVIVV